MIRCEKCRAPLEFLETISDPDTVTEPDLPYFTEVWACRNCRLLYGTDVGRIVFTLVPPKGREDWAFFGIKHALGKGDA